MSLLTGLLIENSLAFQFPTYLSVPENESNIFFFKSFDSKSTKTNAAVSIKCFGVLM